MTIIKEVIRLYLKKYLFLLIAIIFLAVYYFSAKSLPGSAIHFPRLIITYVYIPVVLWNLIGSFFEIKEKLPKQVKKVKATAQKEFDMGEIKKAIGLVFIFVYIFFIPRFGFFASTSVYLAAFSFLLGIRSPIKAGFYILIINSFIYFLFAKWLGISFPSGILF